MKYLFIYVFFIFSFQVFSKNLGAHVHGYISLDMAVEKKQLLVMLHSPADSFLGFEYQAKTKKEKLIVKSEKTAWENNILTFISNGSLDDCKVTKASWKQQFSSKNHSNIVAEAYIKCDKKLKSREINISFKKRHPRIKEVAFQLIREDGSVISQKFQSDTFKVKL